MITHLSISNYTLIDKLDIEFTDGFSVITGETGAGKSIILGAIGLLLGQRADIKLIKQGTQRCVIEAHFDLSNYDLSEIFISNDIDYDAKDTILRRELTSAGKSRAFINDTPVALSLMKELGEKLVDIHSQHQNLLLRKEDFQLNVVDIMAENQTKLGDYRIQFNEYQSLIAEYNRLKESLETNKQNEDFLRYQLNELTEANLQEDEQTTLEQETVLMENAEDIKNALSEAYNQLSGEDGCIMVVRQSQRNLQSVATMVDRVQSLTERVEGCYIELKDIADEVNDILEQVDYDPNKLAMNQERLNLIYRLQKKHNVDTVGELLKIQHNIEQQVSGIDDSDVLLQEKRQQIEACETQCKRQAQAISKSRHTISKQIEKTIKSKLADLGMPNVQFEIHFNDKPLSVDGSDKVDFQFSANKNVSLQPISDVASGGEIARVMLALKAMISGTVKLPTIIFDEIDTGVSGKAAEQMANIMGDMGKKGRQVISITHLPQIAAQGKTHYRVYKQDTKEGTQTNMLRLNDEDRIAEIAQMLSGSEISKAAVDNAKQLINNSIKTQKQKE